MAKTESAMLPLGTKAPAFSLPDVLSHDIISLPEHKGSVATVIAFICNHCPYVKHINQELPRLAKDFKPLGVRFIAINSNDVEEYPEDDPEHMAITAVQNAYCFPYLYDETQDVARAYDARCTPDFFVFDDQLALVYRGQLDDSRVNSDIPVTGSSIRQALQCLIERKPVPTEQKASLGCGIKWKKSEPRA